MTFRSRAPERHRNPPADHRFLMDTHTWLWVTASVPEYERLAVHWREDLGNAATGAHLYASDASVWELALKEASNKLPGVGEIDSFIEGQTKRVGVQILPLSAEVIIASTRLPKWLRSDGREHRDPADRFLVATARIHGLILVTADETMLAYAKRGNLRALDARI